MDFAGTDRLVFRKVVDHEVRLLCSPIVSQTQQSRYMSFRSYCWQLS